MNCPTCAQTMEPGYQAASGVPWIDPAEFESFLVTGVDVSDTPRWKAFFPSKAEFFRSGHCSACKIVTVDYSERLPRADVEAEN